MYRHCKISHSTNCMCDPPYRFDVENAHAAYEHDHTLISRIEVLVSGNDLHLQTRLGFILKSILVFQYLLKTHALTLCYERRSCAYDLVSSRSKNISFPAHILLERPIQTIQYRSMNDRHTCAAQPSIKPGSWRSVYRRITMESVHTMGRAAARISCI